MKLSVIVPVYNVEKYLDDCVQSVLKQNFTDFELLLINDGSTDHSGKLCDEYAAADRRVRVFHKENGGVSSARNLGIENATGQWITFIDSDDYILDNFFSALSDDNIANLIMQGFEYMESGICIKENTYDPEVLNREDFILKYNLYPDFSSSWSKFFRNSILKAHQIKFNTRLSFGEDTLFNLKYLQFCNEIVTTNNSRYSYRIVGGGLSNTVVDYRHDLLFYKESRALLLKYNNRKFYNKSILISLSRLLTSMYSDESLSTSERKKTLKDVVETNYEVIYQVYTDPKIKMFFMFAHYTGVYSVLDFVMSRVGK